MEIFSTLLALCERNLFPSQRPVTRSFDVFFDLRLNKRLSKQSRRRDLRSHGVHYDVTVMCSRLYKYQVFIAFVDLFYHNGIVANDMIQCYWTIEIINFEMVYHSMEAVWELNMI